MGEKEHSLKSFFVQKRFGKSTQTRWQDDKITRLEKTLRAAVAGHPYLVIVHAPFPEPAQREVIHNEGISYALSGRGVGKTALLAAFVDVAQTVKEAEVLAFLDNREKITDADNFFKDFFAEEILKRRRGLRNTSVFWVLESWIRRTALLARTSILMAGAFLAWLFSALGLEVLKYFYDPNVHSGVNNLLRVLSQYRGWVWIIGPLLLMGLLLGFVGNLEANEKLKIAYSALSPSSLMQIHKNNQKERLLANPANVFSFLSRRKCLVLVIDDVDCLDSRSVDSIIDLFEAAQNSNGKYRACVVLSFNPRNPALWLPERERIRELLSEESIKAAQSWLPICIAPMDLEQLTEILCEYFGDSTPRRLLKVLGEEDPEALQRTGQLLGFFVWLETVLAKEQRSLRELQESELIAEFQRYVCRDLREIEEIVDALRSQDETGGSLTLLKFLLAFQKHPVRADLLAEALSEEGYGDIGTYERILRDPPARLIRKVRNGSYWCYEFREAYLRHLFLTGWGEWKEQSEYYSTKVFDLLCKHRIWEPEQALKSQPSKEAVEILYSQGLFYYQYYGHSDAGYALRFLGLERGGATGKWLSLCRSAVEMGENLWCLLFWNPGTFLNPYRGYKTSRSPWSSPIGRGIGEKEGGWFFAPDLLLNTAIAYWLMGYTQQALDLLINQWQWIKKHLLEYPEHWSDVQIDACKRHFREADAEIALTAAKILLHLGRNDSWKQAMQICRPYIRGERPASRRQLALAKFIATNIQHYQHFGTGNLFPPLRFSYNGALLEELLSVGTDETIDDLIRFRAFYTSITAVWDNCLKKLISPQDTLDRGVPFDAVDRNQLERLRQILKQALDLLVEFRSRPKPRPQDVPPGGRAAEGELFFWEAVFLYYRYLLLAVDIGRAVDQYRSTIESGKWHSRLSVYNSLVGLCVEFINCGLFSPERHESLSEAAWGLKDWIEDLMGKSAPGLQGDEVKRRFKDLYLELTRATMEQSTEHFLSADTIYRRLGHKQGCAEILFQRGLMQWMMCQDGGAPNWCDLLMKCNYATGTLGFHLDSLYSHLLVAQAAESSHAFVAVNNYQNAMSWCLYADLGIPNLILGEIAFRLGLQFLNLEQIRGAKENALQLMEMARQVYEPYMEPYMGGERFIAPEEAFERMLSIRWNIAELTRRKAATSTGDDRNRLLNRAEESCNWIINRTKGETKFAAQEMSARVIKADITRLRGDFRTAIQELQTAIEYYEREKDQFWLLQTLTIMCETILSAREVQEVLTSQDIITYLNRLIHVAQSYAERFGKNPNSLGLPEKIMFFRASRLLAWVWYYQCKKPDVATYWLFVAFDLLTSLGLFGNAILLDEFIREVLSSHGVAQDYEAYKNRLIQASQRISSKDEEADWQRVGAILRHYFPIQVPATEHVHTKQECVRTYEAMKELGRLPEAVEALEKGANLIDYDNPEEVDFELLERLCDVYREMGEHEKAVQVEGKQQELRDINQSRNFLLLAEKYRENGWDPRWALEIATEVSFRESRYYRKALAMLDEIRATAL